MIKRILALLTGLTVVLGLGVAAASPASASTLVTTDQATYTLPHTSFVHNNGVIDGTRNGTVTIKVTYTQSVDSSGRLVVSPGNHLTASGSRDISIQNNSNAVYDGNSLYPNGMRGIEVTGFLYKDRNSTNTGWENWASALTNAYPFCNPNFTFPDAYVQQPTAVDGPGIRTYPVQKTSSGGHAQYNVDPEIAGSNCRYDNFSEGRDIGVGYRFGRYLPVASNSRPTFSGLIQWYGETDIHATGTLYTIEAPVLMTNP